MRHLCLLLLLLAALTGCAGARATQDLSPGMTTDQVRAVLGTPSQTQFVAERLVWKYSLH